MAKGDVKATALALMYPSNLFSLMSSTVTLAHNALGLRVLTAVPELNSLPVGSLASLMIN